MGVIRPAWECLRAAPSLGSVLRRLAYPSLRDWLTPWKALLFLGVRPYTMLPRVRLNSLYELARRCKLERVPGAFVECGIWRGGSATVLVYQAKGRPVWLFDSFNGCPEPTAADVSVHGRAGEKGEARASPQWLLRILELVGAGRNVEIHQGWFKDSLPAAVPGIDRIALLHLDGDWHESTKTCLRNLYPLVVQGGYVQVDDYFYWSGAQRAVKEYFGLDLPVLNQIDDTGVWWRKQ